MDYFLLLLRRYSSFLKEKDGENPSFLDLIDSHLSSSSSSSSLSSSSLSSSLSPKARKFLSHLLQLDKKKRPNSWSSLRYLSFFSEREGEREGEKENEKEQEKEEELKSFVSIFDCILEYK